MSAFEKLAGEVVIESRLRRERWCVCVWGDRNANDSFDDKKRNLLDAIRLDLNFHKFFVILDYFGPTKCHVFE